MYSGVPKAGDPDLISTFEENEPYIIGAPGRTNCVKVTRAKISAAMKGRPKSEEHKQKIKEAWRKKKKFSLYYG